MDTRIVSDFAEPSSSQSDGEYGPGQHDARQIRRDANDMPQAVNGGGAKSRDVDGNNLGTTKSEKVIARFQIHVPTGTELRMQLKTQAGSTRLLVWPAGNVELTTVVPE